MNDYRSNSGSVGFTCLLQIAFIVLKLLDKITWPWIWVLAPTWMAFALVILGLIIGSLLMR